MVITHPISADKQNKQNVGARSPQTTVDEDFVDAPSDYLIVQSMSVDDNLAPFSYFPRLASVSCGPLKLHLVDRLIMSSHARRSNVVFVRRFLLRRAYGNELRT